MARPKTKVDKFKYQVGEKVRYVGRLYDWYECTECEVISRSTQRYKLYYKVRFNDGKELTFSESTLVKLEDIENDKNETNQC